MRIIRQRSPVVSKLVNCGSMAHDPVAVAQGASMTAQDSLAILDTYGFVGLLGELALSSVRGSMVVAVVDLWDIRPICRAISVPCLEPWDEDSLSEALREAFSYSSVIEKPYVVRLNPVLARQLCNAVSGIRTLGERPVFNRNWELGGRWRLPEQWVSSDEWVRLALSRAREHVKGGDVLVEGYLQADNSAARSLYVNPLPVGELAKVRVIEEGRPFMVNLIRAVNPNVEFRDSRARYEEAVREAWRLIDNGPIDPAAPVRFCLLKLIRDGKLGNVPIIVSSPYLIRPSGTAMRPDYNPDPTYFMPRNINDIVDATHVNPLGVLMGIGDYQYGSRLTITTSCEPLEDAGPNAVIVAMEECPPLTGVNVTEVSIGSELSKVCQLVNEALSGGRVWVKLSESRSELRANVDKGLCDLCGDCIALGCRAIKIDEQGYPRIDPSECIGCGLCVNACSRGAISLVKPSQA
jgi:indolepyruvate ferredoxin oxidoreductase alpha subunit